MIKNNRLKKKEKERRKDQIKAYTAIYNNKKGSYLNHKANGVNSGQGPGNNIIRAKAHYITPPLQKQGTPPYRPGPPQVPTWG